LLTCGGYRPHAQINIMSAAYIWPVFRWSSMAGFGCSPRGLA